MLLRAANGRLLSLISTLNPPFRSRPYFAINGRGSAVFGLVDGGGKNTALHPGALVIVGGCYYRAGFEGAAIGMGSVQTGIRQ